MKSGWATFNSDDEQMSRLQSQLTKAFANIDTPASLVVKTVTANYLVSADDDVVLCDPSQGSFTVSLPAIGQLTKPVSLRLLSGLSTKNTVTVRAPNPVTVDAGASAALTTAPLRLVSNAQGYWSS